MTQIFVICEGQTEVDFVEKVLNEAFSSEGICFAPTLLGKTGHKGGNVTFERIMKDIRVFQRTPGCYVTTFFDFYGLNSRFPGKSEAEKVNSSKERSKILLDAFEQELDEEFSEKNYDYRRRIIPYVQMHEFEALLFSDPAALAQSLDQSRLESEFLNVRQKYSTPEEINNSEQTAPSKRIARIFPEYGKPEDGIEAAKQIGLETMRQKCPLFNEWLEKLEKLEDL